MGLRSKGKVPLVLDDRAVRRTTEWAAFTTDRGWRPYQPRLYPDEGVLGVLTLDIPVMEEARRG